MTSAPKTEGSVYILRAIDPATASVAQEARIEITDWKQLCCVMQMPLSEFDVHAVYELDSESVSALVKHFNLDFDTDARTVELHSWHPNDNLPYRVHTGRELALMLAGTKPLAAFVDEHPSSHGLYIIPEKEFEPLVAAGRIVKREDPPQLCRALVGRRRREECCMHYPMRHGGSRRICCCGRQPRNRVGTRVSSGWKVAYWAMRTGRTTSISNAAIVRMTVTAGLPRRQLPMAMTLETSQKSDSVGALYPFAGTPVIRSVLGASAPAYREHVCQ